MGFTRATAAAVLGMIATASAEAVQFSIDMCKSPPATVGVRLDSPGDGNWWEREPIAAVKNDNDNVWTLTSPADTPAGTQYKWIVDGAEDKILDEASPRCQKQDNERNMDVLEAVVDVTGCLPDNACPPDPLPHCPTNKDDWNTGNGIGNTDAGCTPACTGCANTQHKVFETPPFCVVSPFTTPCSECPNRVCIPKTLESCPSDGSKVADVGVSTLTGCTPYCDGCDDEDAHYLKSERASCGIFLRCSCSTRSCAPKIYCPTEGKVAAPPGVLVDTCYRVPFVVFEIPKEPCHCHHGWAKSNIDTANPLSPCYICVNNETTTASTTNDASPSTSSSSFASVASVAPSTTLPMNEAAKTSRNTGVDADTAETASSTTGQPQVAVNTSATNGNGTDTDGANVAPSLPGQSKHGDGGGGGGGGTAGAISIPVLLVLAFALIAAFYHRRKRQQHGAEAAAMAAAAAAVSVDNPAFAPPAGVARRAGVVVVGNNQQAYVVPMAGEDEEGGGEEKRNEETRATAASSAVAEAAYVAPSRSQAVAYELGQVPGARDHPRASPNINQVYEPPMPPPPPVATASGPNYEDVDEAAHTGPSPTQPGDAEYAVVDEGGQQQLVLDGDGYVEGGSLPTAASSNSGLAMYAQPSASTTVYGESSSSA